MQEHELQIIIAALREGTAETIERVVNGKIKRIDEKLDKYIVQDTEWKLTIQPVIDAYATAENAGKFVQWAARILAALGILFGIKHFW